LHNHAVLSGNTEDAIFGAKQLFIGAEFKTIGAPVHVSQKAPNFSSRIFLEKTPRSKRQSILMQIKYRLLYKSKNPHQLCELVQQLLTMRMLKKKTTTGNRGIIEYRVYYRV
jgi:hypothetical protein